MKLISQNEYGHSEAARCGAGECLAFTVPRRLMNAPKAKLVVDSSLQEKLRLHVNAAQNVIADPWSFGGNRGRMKLKQLFFLPQ